MRSIAGADVTREHVGRLNGRIAKPCHPAEPVVLEERDANLPDFVGLDDAEPVAHAGAVAVVRSLIRQRPGVGTGERDTRPIPVRRRHPVIELIRQHVTNEVRHCDVTQIREVLQPGVGEHRIEAGRIVRPSVVRLHRVPRIRVAVGAVQAKPTRSKRNARQKIVRRESQDLIVGVTLNRRPRKELIVGIELDRVTVQRALAAQRSGCHRQDEKKE